MSLDLLDNDIAYKICCFRLLAEFKQLFTEKTAPHRLGLAAFVIPKKIARSSRVKDKTSAQEQLVIFLSWAVGLEPTDEEIALAADIETIAQQLNIPFDSGESLLLSVLLTRDARRLFTGDKRAIRGLRSICDRLGRAEAVASKIVCFEQVMLVLLAVLGAEELIARICREPDVDKMSAICCGCASGGTNEASIAEGLLSYIKDLRGLSGPVLSP